MATKAEKHISPTCQHCGSLLSAVTWQCVRGDHCPGVRGLGRVPTTCLETAYGTTQRLSFQIKVF